MGLSPVSFGVVGLAVAFLANGMQLLGAHGKGEEAISSGKTVAVVGSIAAAISLLFFTVWYIVGAPFGNTDAHLVSVQLLFATLGGKFGLLWIGVAAAQLKGWSFKPIGTMCAFLSVMHIIEMAILAKWGLNLTSGLLEVVFAIYLPVLWGFALLPYGKFSARLLGWICLIAAFATLYTVYVPSGIVHIQ